MTRPIRFIHITDTHIGPSKDYKLHGYNTYDTAIRQVAAINSIAFEVDFVVHTGDVIADPHRESYGVAAAIYSELKFPIYFINGNHDDRPGLVEALKMAPKKDLAAAKELLSYTFEIQGIKFLTIDMVGPKEIDPHGLCSPQQLEILRDELRDSKPTVIFGHFPFFNFDCIWLDRDMLVLNSELVESAISTPDGKVLAYFFGHIHRPFHAISNGVMYSAAASACFQIQSYPPQTGPVLEGTHQASFNLVTVSSESVLVKEIGFPTASA